MTEMPVTIVPEGKRSGLRRPAIDGLYAGPVDGVIWYAFRVPPQKEAVAQSVLKKRGFSPWIPTEVRILRKRGQRRKASERTYPMMLGYVLIPFTGPVPWHELFRLNIIKSVVGFGGVPYQIPALAISEIQKKSRTAVPTRVNTRRSIAIGESAILNCSGFEDFPVKVEDIKGEKARVLLRMFNVDRQISVELRHLEPA